MKRVKNLKQKNNKLITNNQKLNLIVNILKKNKKIFETKIVKSKKKTQVNECFYENSKRFRRN